MQDIELDIPFAPRISPDLEAARARNLEWLTSADLLTSAENQARYLDWQLADLAARFYPDAVGDDLVLGVQGQSFFFFFDDLFDGRLGADPVGTYAICHEMAALAHRSPDSRLVQPTFPLAHVWLDHWSRAQEGMSEAWKARTARHWAEYFLSYAAEAVNRKSGTVLDVDGYLKLRRHAIGAQPVLDTTERCGHFEAPAEIHESMCMRQLRDLTCEVVILANDLSSLEKDEANGEPNNIILLLLRQHCHKLGEAIEVVQEMTRQRIARFQLLSLEADRLCEALELPLRERESVARFVEANRACMRGNYDWGRSTGRYDRTGVQYVKESPRIEDRVSLV